MSGTCSNCGADATGKKFCNRCGKKYVLEVQSEPLSVEKKPSRVVACDDCGGTVSRRAVACPHCGAPRRSASTPPQDTWKPPSSWQSSSDDSSMYDGVRKTDPFAVVTFAAGLGGLVLLPIIFVPVAYVTAIVSYYRLKENPMLKGQGLRVTGAIFNTISLLYLMYQYKFGFFA